MLAALFQDPTAPIPVPPAAMPTAGSGSAILQQLEAIGWIDRTALIVIGVFFVIGLFKGLVWQVSRVAILVAGYVVAGRFGGELALLMAKLPALGSYAADGTLQVPETTLYIAYVTAFVVVVILLSLLAMLLQKALNKVGLGFFDRIGGGVLGVATGACVVLFGLFVVHMFARGTALAQAAEASHTMRLSQKAVEALGLVVPDDLRKVLELAPLRADAAVPGGLGAGTRLPGGTMGTATDATAPLGNPAGTANGVDVTPPVTPIVPQNPPR